MIVNGAGFSRAVFVCGADRNAIENATDRPPRQRLVKVNGR
jgi:hypothetical protein